jgi:hypothetical protein
MHNVSVHTKIVKSAVGNSAATSNGTITEAHLPSLTTPIATPQKQSAVSHSSSQPQTHTIHKSNNATKSTSSTVLVWQEETRSSHSNTNTSRTNEHAIGESKADSDTVTQRRKINIDNNVVIIPGMKLPIVQTHTEIRTHTTPEGHKHAATQSESSDATKQGEPHVGSWSDAECTSFCDIVDIGHADEQEGITLASVTDTGEAKKKHRHHHRHHHHHHHRQHQSQQEDEDEDDEFFMYNNTSSSPTKQPSSVVYANHTLPLCSPLQVPSLTFLSFHRKLFRRM